MRTKKKIHKLAKHNNIILLVAWLSRGVFIIYFQSTLRNLSRNPCFDPRTEIPVECLLCCISYNMTAKAASRHVIKLYTYVVYLYKCIILLYYVQNGVCEYFHRIPTHAVTTTAIAMVVFYCCIFFIIIIIIIIEILIHDYDSTEPYRFHNDVFSSLYSFFGEKMTRNISSYFYNIIL